MAINGRERQISKQARLARILTLKISGLRVNAITKLMTEEGYKVSDRTIQRILVSHTAKELADELINQQLADITRADPPQRLMYRHKLLEILIPKPNTEINISQQQTTMEVKKNEFTYEGFLGKYGKVFAEQLLREEVESNRITDGQDPEEPLHPP